MLDNIRGNKVVVQSIEDLLNECRKVVENKKRLREGYINKEYPYRTDEEKYGEYSNNKIKELTIEIEELENVLDIVYIESKLFNFETDIQYAEIDIMKWLYSKLTERQLHIINETIVSIANRKKFEADRILSEYYFYNNLIMMKKAIQHIKRCEEKEQ